MEIEIKLHESTVKSKNGAKCKKISKVETEVTLPKSTISLFKRKNKMDVLDTIMHCDLGYREKQMVIDSVKRWLRR